MAQAETAPAAPAAAPAAAANTSGPVLTTGTQAAPEPSMPGPQPDFLSAMFSNPLFYLVIGVWFWVFWSTRKHRQKEDQRKKELGEVKKGDQVVTIGRVHGTVVGLTETTMTLKTDPKANFTVTFDRVALFKVVNNKEEAAATNAEDPGAPS